MATRLHITHSWGGGVGRWVSDFCRGDAMRRSLLLRSRTDRNHAAYQLELLDAAQPTAPLSTWHLQVPIRTTDLGNPEYRSILHGVIAAHGVGDVVVSSLLGHTFEALDTGLPTVVVLHDLYPFCPALFACFGSPCSACDGGRLQRCLQVNPHNVFWHNSTAQDWLSLREAYVERLSQPWVALVAPTACVRDRWAALLPAFAALPWRQIAHGLDQACFAPVPRAPTLPASPLRIVVPGRLAPHKGLNLLRQALPQLQGAVEVLLLGCGDFGQVLDGVPGVRIVPEYALEGLRDEIGRFGPDCALLLSVLPESYSYTLSEMQALNVPVLATRLGAFVERIEEGRTGLLFDPDVDGLLACVRRVAADRALLIAIAANLAERARRGLADMVRDYDALLAALPARAQRPAAAATLSGTAAAVSAGTAAAAPSPVDAAQAQVRNEVRGTFYLADAARIIVALVPADDAVAAARLTGVALACAAARNDVHFYVVGAGEHAPLWGMRRDDIALLLATRRLFFVDGVLSRDRLLAGADAVLSLGEGETAVHDEVAALRAGRMLLTFGASILPPRARCGGQAAVLVEARPEAAAAALSYWLDRSDAERARVAARTRQDLAAAGTAAAAVVAVVVTHQPVPERLSALLAALSPQVDRVILVDNGSQPPIEPWLLARDCPNLDPLLLPDNIGLASAQNVGIDRARALGADFVLLSDQDSVPEADMVEALLEAVRSLRQQGLRVGAVGPRYREADGLPGPFVRLRGLRYQRLDCSDGGDLVEVDHLIASGCLIPLPVLDEIGDMTAELFIDYVDVEWGLRARRAGYRCFGVCAAGMRHERGRASLRMFGRAVPVHDPLRLYYQHRNAVWLMRQHWLGRRWKLANALRLARNLCVYALLPGSRLARWRMALKGTLHGLRGTMGRAPAGIR